MVVARSSSRASRQDTPRDHAMKQPTAMPELVINASRGCQALIHSVSPTRNAANKKRAEAFAADRKALLATTHHFLFSTTCSESGAFCVIKLMWNEPCCSGEYNDFIFIQPMSSGTVLQQYEDIEGQQLAQIGAQKLFSFLLLLN